ncbi:unnamed protein product [Blepharisma stoltei]|uniref:Uncharacterized protein n=1 Tax=Blepharisma stoltei TaxID=1481888 RepID=A0AAU9IFE5_9CILI|nr:unnamed protein product [Blepharisma stoltei]
MDSKIRDSKAFKCNPLYRFYNTLEGALIEFIRNEGQASLHQIMEHIEGKKKRLRTISSRKYKKESVEELVFPALFGKKKLFNQISAGVWTVNTNFALEYEQKVVKEIERIKEKNNQESYERYMQRKITLKEEEKLKIFEKSIDTDIYNKLDQLVDILESSNEEMQRQFQAFMELNQLWK